MRSRLAIPTVLAVVAACGSGDVSGEPSGPTDVAPTVVAPTTAVEEPGADATTTPDTVVASDDDAALQSEPIGERTASETAADEQPEDLEGVVVDLAVDWRPEHELSESERREQRARIEAAQDEVVADLGAHGELRRRLTESAQMSVGVDGRGREILAGHRLVARVQDDAPESAGPDSPG